MPFQGIQWHKEIDNLKQLGADGVSLSDIAKIYKISRQRIDQVIHKHLPNWHDDYTYPRQRAAAKEFMEKRYAKWGDEAIDKDLYEAQRSKFLAKKNNAKRTGRLWDLEYGDIKWPTHCPILKIELDYFADGRQENSPSFDQIVPDDGYIPGNVHIISWRANRIKNNGTAEEHYQIAEWLDWRQ